MTSIVVLSDLHLEFGNITIANPQKADVLILAGDIIIADKISTTEEKTAYRYIHTQRYKEFFDRVSVEFKNIIYIAGNHEFYDGKWNKSLTDIQEFLINYSNVHFLEKSYIDLEGIIFMGGTTWTDMNKCDPLTLQANSDKYNGLHDFQCIRNDENGYRKLSTMNTVIRHKETLKCFEETAKKFSDRKIVIVMHHAPHQKSISKEYANQYLMNGAFASDLSEFILDHPNIKLVAHGHMHNSSDYMIGNTRVICNPRGYTPDYLNNEFSPCLTVEI